MCSHCEIDQDLDSLTNFRSIFKSSSSRSPARVFWTIAVAVFSAEIVIMFILPVFPAMGPVTTALVDSTILIVIVAPFLYQFLFKPLTRHIERRRRMENFLKTHKDMLQTVFDGISDPLILLDDDLKIKMLNQSATEYYDVDLNDIFDKRCHDAFRKKGIPYDECQISEVVTGNRNITFERSSAIDPMGSEKVVVYRSAPQGGRSGGVIIRISDITEAKNMERQMMHQEKMASLGLLISSIAHEINNPNNMISLNLPILKSYLDAIMPLASASENKNSVVEHLNISFEEVEKDAFQIIASIELGSERINSIVSQLKQFSRIEKNKTDQVVDIRQVIDNAVSICKGEIKRYISSFQVHISDDLPAIHTNGEYLEQVLINLLINACHAADKIDAWIKLRVFSGRTWDKYVVIEVSDNGHGMEADTMAKIFEPMFTTKDEKGGTGLGLYVSYNLVESLGGRLEVESTFGRGSTFHVFLTDRERRARKRLGKGRSL